jgi:hypothetical protein
MKVALCFLISYEQVISKEHIWREWIEANKDIINVYFHYKDYSTIESEWIKKHTIPKKFIVETSYYHVVHAYFSTMHYAFLHDTSNKWFCFLTDSCVPIVNPFRFREMFFNHYNETIMNWKKAWWNIHMHKRANLRQLSEEYRLANEPWFIIKREDVHRCIVYSNKNTDIFRLICAGGLANESIFAIILYSMNGLERVKREVTHCADWSRMSSTTSPHIFKEGSKRDLDHIDSFLKENQCTLFLRKVDSAFPDSILLNYIYEREKISEDRVSKLKRTEYVFFFKRVFSQLMKLSFLGFILFSCYYVYISL